VVAARRQIEHKECLQPGLLYSQSKMPRIQAPG
jgi:hypothetical protein